MAILFVVLSFFPLMAFSVFGQSRDTVSLDKAISDSALQIQNGLAEGSTVIVFQFQSFNGKLSEYILNELFDRLVNARKFTVLDRGAQAIIDTELAYQFKKSAGMISDDSLASLTKRMGAQAIVTGSLDDAGGEYRFRMRVIGTDTTAALISYAGSVNKTDRRIAAFSKPQPGVGQKIGTGALNILFGLGSYLEGDIFGGLTITAGYTVAAGFFVIEAMALDWDSPAAGVPATIGITAAGLTLAYGFVRPFIYRHSPKVAAITDNIRSDIVWPSDKHTESKYAGLQMSYTIHF